jgi:hypothetical protein
MKREATVDMVLAWTDGKTTSTNLYFEPIEIASTSTHFLKGLEKPLVYTFMFWYLNLHEVTFGLT